MLSQAVPLDIEVEAQRQIELPGDGVAHAEARPVLDRQPGAQHARQLDEHEQHEQHDGKDEGKLHHSLAAPTAAHGRGGGRMAGWHPVHHGRLSTQRMIAVVPGRRGMTAPQGGIRRQCVIRVKMREAMASNTSSSPEPVGE